MVLNHLRTFSVFWGSEWDPGRKSDCWMMRVQIPHLTTHLFKKGDRLALGGGQCLDSEHCQARFSLLEKNPISNPAVLSQPTFCFIWNICTSQSPSRLAVGQDMP